MRKSFKNFLSLLLVIGILAGSFIFAPSAVAADSGVKLVLNGGTLADPDETYGEGDLLPDYTQVTRGSDTFGGWYATANFQNTQEFTAKANTTYYARWVKHDVDVTDFDAFTEDDYNNHTVTTNESGVTTTGAIFRIYDNQQSDDRWSQLNVSKYNTYSGNNSMKFVLASGDTAKDAYEFGNTNNHLWWDSDIGAGRGFCFWISTNTTITLKFTTNYHNGTSVTVPQGRHIITLPNTDGEELNAKIVFKCPARNATVYIDDIGTFSDVIHNVTHDTFDSYDDIKDMIIDNRWADWQRDYDLLSINSDPKHIYNGAHSVKITAIENGLVTYLASNRMSFSCEGDGSVFWLEAPAGTKVFVQVGAYENGNATDTIYRFKSEEISFTGGKQLVKFQWNSLKGVKDTAYAGQAMTDCGLTNFFEFAIMITLPKAGDVAYVDEIGIYDESPETVNTITYNLNGGEWAQGYNAPVTYSAAKVALPAYYNFKSGCIFGGWYDNADFTGTPVIVTPESGNLTLYAKWILKNEVIDNFESATIGWTPDSNNVAELSSNANSYNRWEGNKSLNVHIKKRAGIEDTFLGAINKTGITAINTQSSKGLYFWVENQWGSTGLTVKVNNTYSYTLTVYNGKTFVSIPWSLFGDGTLQGDITSISITFTQPWNVDSNIFIDDVATYYDVAELQNKLVMTGALFNNGTGIELKDDVTGHTMPNNSAIYKDPDGTTQRSAFRFVCSYDYVSEGTEQYLDAGKKIKIVKRGMNVGVYRNNMYQQKDKSEVSANSAAWDKIGNTLKYSYLLYNIKASNRELEYYAEPYLIVENYGRQAIIKGAKVKSSVDGIYAEFSETNPGYAWYTAQ